MKVGLAGYDPKLGGGLNRYARNIHKRVRKNGMEVDNLFVKHPNRPLAKTFHSFFSMPPYIAEKSKEYDVIHVTNPVFSLPLKFVKPPTVLSIHDIIPLLKPEIINLNEGLRNWVFNKFNKYVFGLWYNFSKFTDKVIAVSEQTKEDLVERGWDKGDITVIPEPVSDKFRPMDVDGSDKKTLGYFGPLTYRKRPHLVVKVLKHLSDDWVAWLCGSEDKKDYLNFIERRARDEGVFDRVKIKGWIPEGELVETINMFDVMFFPSSFEGFGLPILEVRRCGVPVIIMEDGKIPRETAQYCEVANSIEEVSDFSLDLLGESLDVPNQPITEEEQVERTIKVYEEVIEE